MVNLTTDLDVFLLPNAKVLPTADISLLQKKTKTKKQATTQTNKKNIRISCSTLNIKWTSHDEHNHRILEVAIQ